MSKYSLKEQLTKEGQYTLYGAALGGIPIAAYEYWRSRDPREVLRKGLAGSLLGAVGGYTLGKGQEIYGDAINDRFAIVQNL